MALTPADVHNVAFNKPPLGRRGYNEDEVDAFLDRVEAEMIELVTERDSLREKLAAGGGGAAVAAPPVLTPATRGTVDDGALKAVTAERDKLKERIAELEQQVASKPAAASDDGDDRVKALEDARSERDGLKNEIASLTNQYKTLSTERDILKVKTGQLENALKEAQAKLDAPQDPTAPATRLMAMAQEVADRLHADAKAEAARTVGEATKQADALLGKAREQANATEGELSRRRVELESKIDQLKAFEREYRTHLRTYLTSQLSELDEEKQLVGKK